MVSVGDKSKIEWTDSTWSPITGCTKVSAGCDHCYAETIARRFAGTKAYPNGFEVTLRPERLDQPLRWRKPRKVFVNSMSDLFHDAVPDRFIGEVFSVMGATPQHTYQILTKRHRRMRSLLRRWTDHLTKGCYCPPDQGGCSAPMDVLHGRWPLPNVWLGVSVESQQWADIRIPALLETPAAVRFLSCEPLLGPVDLRNLRARNGALIDCLAGDVKTPEGEVYAACPSAISWVIAGGESGPGARPMHPDWARSLRDQCQATGVPFFFKQWGEWRPEPVYDTVSGRFHVVMPDGRDRGVPWSGWKLDQPDAVVMERVGKGDAGRELDGRVWDEFPVAVSVHG